MCCRMFWKKRKRVSNTIWFDKLAYEEYNNEVNKNDSEFVYENIGVTSEGISYQIAGETPLDCERFIIDFMDKQSTNIYLHVCPRIPHHYVIRNTRINNLWGKVEVASPFPFRLRRGSKFTLEVLVTKECFMISINGHHFAEFKHRMPFSFINCIVIKGDVKSVTVLRRVVKSYPLRSETFKRLRIATSFIVGAIYENSVYDTMAASITDEFRLIRMGNQERAGRHSINAVYSLPYYGRIEPPFSNGCCLRIEGRSRVLPHSFEINLQEGYHVWPRPNIAFHFSPHYFNQVKVNNKLKSLQEHFVLCNSYVNDHWSKEVRYEILNEFPPGQAFSLAIICSDDRYEVYLNRRWMLDFVHRLPPSIVNILHIEGDIKIFDITLDTQEWASLKRKIFKHPDYDIDY